MTRPTNSQLVHQNWRAIYSYARLLRGLTHVERDLFTHAVHCLSERDGDTCSLESVDGRINFRADGRTTKH